MNDKESDKTDSILLTKLSNLDRILRIREIRGVGGITTGGKAQTKDEPVGHLTNIPPKNAGKWVSTSDAPAMPAEGNMRQFDSFRLLGIENRLRDLESRLERLEKMML